MNAGQTIKKLRKEHHLTQSQLGAKLNVAATTVSSWERGAAYPLMTTAKAMADLFGVPVSVVAGESDVPERDSKSPDLADDDIVLTFEGKQIPPEDLEIMRRFLRGGSDDDK
ncbi:MAG: helix-turn-helix domain-containing protein [Lacticaseibacillus songhuajiangensis]|jgi:transcriptional regulator with XRE-family HTH domain|nr:helix-turn-helix domain-containing protein [Lacticaseibacillus songhuajiangensis]